MLLSCNIWHLQWPGMCLFYTSHTVHPDGYKLGLHLQADLPWSALVHLLVCWLIIKAAKGECPKPELPWNSATLHWEHSQTPRVSANCTAPPCSSCKVWSQPRWGRSLSSSSPNMGNVVLTNAPIFKRAADIVGVSLRLQKSPQLPWPNPPPQTFTCGSHKACLSQKKWVYSALAKITKDLKTFTIEQQGYFENSKRCFGCKMKCISPVQLTSSHLKLVNWLVFCFLLLLFNKTQADTTQRLLV